MIYVVKDTSGSTLTDEYVASASSKLTMVTIAMYSMDATGSTMTVARCSFGDLLK